MDISLIKDLKILYVEDEVELRDTTYNSFSVFVKEVVVASNGQDGFDKFSSDKFDLIITDLSMPIMTGTDMIKKIREVDSSIPIIVTTAFGSQNEEVENLKEIGMTTYLMKPVDIRELINTIYNLVS